MILNSLINYPRASQANGENLGRENLGFTRAYVQESNTAFCSRPPTGNNNLSCLQCIVTGNEK